MRQDKARQLRENMMQVIGKARHVEAKANDCNDGATVGVRVRKYVLAKMTASLLDPG